MRELRNRGAEMLERVGKGESLVVTRDGEPVAQVIPLRRRAVSAAELVERRQRLPAVDPAMLRADLDDLLDPAL